MKKTILVLGMMLACAGCTVTATTDTPPAPPQPTLDPVAMADGLELQSDDNETSCQNIHRPTGNQIGQSDLMALGASGLLLESAKIYIELRRPDQSVLSNVRGYVVSNGPTVFSATADCGHVGETTTVRTAGDLIPLQIDLTQGQIQSAVEYGFPLIGQDISNQGPQNPYAKIESPEIPSLGQWFATQGAEGKADIYLDTSEIEIMYSVREAPMSDGTSWFKFVIGRYAVSK